MFHVEHVTRTWQQPFRRRTWQFQAFHVERLSAKGAYLTCVSDHLFHVEHLRRELLCPGQPRQPIAQYRVFHVKHSTCVRTIFPSSTKSST